MNNISNLKEKVLIVIPIINNYKIFKDTFYNKKNLENRKSETISLVRALNVNVLDVLTINISNFSSANLLKKNSLDYTKINFLKGFEIWFIICIESHFQFSNALNFLLDSFIIFLIS